MMNGLRVLTTDQACLDMSNSISESGVTEIYVEDRATQAALDVEEIAADGNETQHKDKAAKQVECDDSSSDSEFVPGDDSSSEKDEEGKEILRKFKQFKKKLRSGQVAHLDDIVLESSTAMLAGYAAAEDGNETPYLDTDDDESIEEADSDG
jgi:hypothetical protein